MMEIVFEILFYLFIVVTIYSLVNKIRETMLFKRGDNPYQRICKKCGTHQHQYRSNVKGYEHHTWWESVYPIGDDEECKCHDYDDYKYHN